MTEAKEAGRPTKYRKEMDDKAYQLCLLGCTNDEIAKFLGVAGSTVDLWIVKHRTFSGAIYAGRDSADMKVAASMYKRACGYTETVTEEYITEELVAPVSIDEETGKAKKKLAQAEQDFEEFKSIEDAKTVKIKHTKNTKQIHMPADFQSMSLWLRNRQPKKWRDKPEESTENKNGITLEGVVANKNAISNLLMPSNPESEA